MIGTKCAKCRMNYQGFHICLGLPKEVMERDESGPAPKKRPSVLPERTEEHREAHAAVMREIWARKNGPRDAKLIERYKKGDIGIRALAAEFHVNYATAQRVLREAQDKGLIVMRPRGENLRWIQKTSA